MADVTDGAYGGQPSRPRIEWGWEMCCYDGTGTSVYVPYLSCTVVNS